MSKTEIKQPLGTSTHASYGSGNPRPSGTTGTMRTAASPTSSSSPSSSRKYGGDFQNVLMAVVNPLSGERSASSAVYRGFVAALGGARVFRLEPVTFKNPAMLADALLQRAREHELQWHTESASLSGGGGSGGMAEPLKSGLRRRPTVLVAGGDGTVAFVMNVIQDAFSSRPTTKAEGPTNKEPATPASPDDLVLGRAHAHPHPSTTAKSPKEELDEVLALAESSKSTGIPSSTQSASLTDDRHDDDADRVPAVGVFPMGTGNDLSETLGFGLGFTQFKCCVACRCCPRDVEAIMRETVDAPVISFDRWEAVVSKVVPTRQAEAAGGSELLRVGFNNYVSIGMDADIATRFDRARRAHPGLHRVRTMNKLWYGVHGLTAAPFAPTFSNRNLTVNIDQTAAPLTSSSNNCKAIVVTNVSSYSGGVDLWDMKQPTLTKLPRHAPGGRGIQPTQVPLQPVAVGDGKLEVQTLGGLLHMTFLRSGMVGADKIGQGAAIDLVITNPDGKPLSVRMQADGEPLGEYHAPFRVQVRPAQRGPLFIHASPTSAAAQRSTSPAVTY
jgi:diacylglycerol kinase family enzyme